MTTNAAPRSMGPIAQAVMRFIMLQSEGQYAAADRLQLEIAGLMRGPVNRLVHAKGMPESRARLFVYLNTLRQIINRGTEGGIDETTVARATSMHNAFMRDRFAPDAPRMRQHASQAAAAKTGVGKNYKGPGRNLTHSQSNQRRNAAQKPRVSRAERLARLVSGTP